jgi:hypothetical protein
MKDLNRANVMLSLDTLYAIKPLSNLEFSFYSLSKERINTLKDIFTFKEEDLENGFGLLGKIGLSLELVEVF